MAAGSSAPCIAQRQPAAAQALCINVLIALIAPAARTLETHSRTHVRDAMRPMRLLAGQGRYAPIEAGMVCLLHPRSVCLHRFNGGAVGWMRRRFAGPGAASRFGTCRWPISALGFRPAWSVSCINAFPCVHFTHCMQSMPVARLFAPLPVIPAKPPVRSCRRGADFAHLPEISANFGRLADSIASTLIFQATRKP